MWFWKWRKQRWYSLYFWKEGYYGKNEDINIKENTKNTNIYIDEKNNNKNEKHNELIVKGIDLNSTEDDIIKTFAKYGKITFFTLLKDKETNKSRGICFIRFLEAKVASLVMHDINNLINLGNNLLIRYSKEKYSEFISKTSN